MPDTPVPAAASGLPKIDRRSTLFGTAALLAAACMPCAARSAPAVPQEPIVALIDAYREGVKAFNRWAASPAGDDEDEWDAKADELYGSVLLRLVEAPPPIHTVEGARVTLLFIVDELRECADPPCLAPLIDSILTFMEGAMS